MRSVQKKLSFLINDVLIGKKYDHFVTLQEELNKNFSKFLDILKDAVKQYFSINNKII